MKKKIVILGATGSIGSTTLDLIQKDKKNFEVILLTANSNYKKLFKLANNFNCINLIIHNKNKYHEAVKKNKNKKLNILNNTKDFLKNFKGRVDYTMSSITGISGLEPTLDAISFSKCIAIANKESIICGWHLIEKKLKKFKTNFIPVDSEHFSIWTLIKSYKITQIEKIIITASGGPFLNLPISKFKNITPQKAVRHPNWSMGKKISIDSATLMNKVFEVIEAQRIFKIPFFKFEILIHPNSYAHAIVKFTNGTSKILLHDTDMKIPIFNTLYNYEYNKKLSSNKIDFKKINNLDFTNVNIQKFPAIKIITKIPENISLFETVIVSANDTLVQLFLDKKIKFSDIYKKLNQITTLKEFTRLKRLTPKSVTEIMKLNQYVYLKVMSLCVITRFK